MGKITQEQLVEDAIEQLSELVADLKAGKIVVVPSKQRYRNTEFCGETLQDVVSYNGRYTLELEIFDDRLRGKRVRDGSR